MEEKKNPVFLHDIKDGKLQIPDDQLEAFVQIRDTLDDYIKKGYIDLADKSSYFLMIELNFNTGEFYAGSAGFLDQGTIVEGLIEALKQQGAVLFTEQIPTPEGGDTPPRDTKLN